MPHLDASHLIAELARHGVATHRIEWGGTHPRLVFEWQGRAMFYVFPGSPSDSRRGHLNAVSDLRRIMGVKRVPEHKSVRAKGKGTMPIIQPPPALGSFAKPDPLAVLSAWRPPYRFQWLRSGPRQWQVIAAPLSPTTRPAPQRTEARDG